MQHNARLCFGAGHCHVDYRIFLKGVQEQRLTMLQFRL